MLCEQARFGQTIESGHGVKAENAKVVSAKVAFDTVWKELIQ